jgi:Peptidase family M28
MIAMRSAAAIVTLSLGSMLATARAWQDPADQADPSSPTPPSPALIAQNTPDPVIKSLVARLDVEKYKATIKGLTQFGDRRQGTQRNRDAVDWIESQLKSYGDFPVGPGGSRRYGNRGRTGVNCDPLLQPDPAIRELDSQPVLPGPVSEVFCTKFGTAHPEEMYIIAAHMDGHGYNQAANDDGSGTALVMELARILASPDVTTDRSIRFALWNGEEGGLTGSRAYVAQRKDRQGEQTPAGSGRYPEPKWLAIIQHDMMLWDHGMPLSDGTLPKEQRPEADLNIEFQSTAAKAVDAQTLAWVLHSANQKYATDYPANVGPHMTNTDSEPFQDLTAAVSLRENERGRDIQAGWDPHWHQPSDVYTTYSEKDFRLGLNAAQTTLAGVAQLAGVRVR